MVAIDHVLTFNYTDTYERVYDTNGNAEYDYIHGKIRRGIDEFSNFDSSIVLGIDEYLDESRRNHDTCFIRFKKFFQRIYKKTSVDYIEWINAIQEQDDKPKSATLNELFIYGHSLSITDGDIIQDLLNVENLITTIFYYNEAMYADQIENLVHIIGENALIAAVNHKRIVFKKQHPLCHR